MAAHESIDDVSLRSCHLLVPSFVLEIFIVSALSANRVKSDIAWIVHLQEKAVNDLSSALT